MKYLVIGSSGQIGLALTDCLKHKNDSYVMTFDIVEDKWMDLRIPGRIDYFMKHTDFVFFLAFDVGGSTYLKTYQNTYDFLGNNTKIIVNTFSALKEYNKPFIFASSQMSNMTFSSYGVLKSLGEHYTKVLKGLIVKFWNVYGIENDPNKTHVITDFIKMALNDGKINMRTNGQEERQFLYANDCAEALYVLSKQYDMIGSNDNIHVTSFKWLKILDVANVIAHTVGNVSVVPGQQIDTIQNGQRNEPDPYILDIWKPKTSISTGINEMVIHYRKEKENNKYMV